jgi:hypothetical protein
MSVRLRLMILIYHDEEDVTLGLEGEEILVVVC